MRVAAMQASPSVLASAQGGLWDPAFPSVGTTPTGVWIHDVVMLMSCVKLLKTLSGLPPSASCTILLLVCFLGGE